MAKRKRVILVTGTPIMHRPAELFNMLKIIRPEIFYNFMEYSQRYCGLVKTQQQPQKRYYYDQHKGSSCTQELHYLLSEHIMIRRLKKDVLGQLPAKIKQKISVTIDPADKAKIKQELAAWRLSG